MLKKKSQFKFYYKNLCHKSFKPRVFQLVPIKGITKHYELMLKCRERKRNTKFP